MRETRRHLKAVNIQLRSQISVHEHTTRKALHEHMALIVGRNKQLIDAYKKLEGEHNSLLAKHAELVESLKQPKAA